VWSSDVDPYGGCGATKEFDSTWTTKSDANERARYVFYWKNTWGMDPEEIHCDEEVEIDGLKKYKVQPDDSSTWTVGVVPDIAFKYLDNADCTRRKRDDHGHDEDAVFLDLNY
jgi:hypothetical protein